jgi:hypothetical protein
MVEPARGLGALGGIALERVERVLNLYDLGREMFVERVDLGCPFGDADLEFGADAAESREESPHLAHDPEQHGGIAENERGMQPDPRQIRGWKDGAGNEETQDHVMRDGQEHRERDRAPIDVRRKHAEDHEKVRVPIDLRRSAAGIDHQGRRQRQSRGDDQPRREAAAAKPNRDRRRQRRAGHEHQDATARQVVRQRDPGDDRDV